MGCGCHLDDGWCTYLDEREVVCSIRLGSTTMALMASFPKVLKAQFEPMSKEVGAREQNRKLLQIGNVNTYIYHFCGLQNELPLMNSVEAYSLLMHGHNPQLHQL